MRLLFIYLLFILNTNLYAFDHICSRYCKISQIIEKFDQNYEFGKKTPDDAVYDDLVKYQASLSDVASFKCDNQNQSKHKESNLKVPHVYFMGSVKKALNANDVEQFIQKTSAHHHFVLQPKIDGIAVELVYINGKLEHASTRGNGYAGKDLLSLLQNAPNIPKCLYENKVLYQKKIVLHGELFLHRNNLPEALILSQRDRHKLAGMITRKKHDISMLRAVSFFPWHWVNSGQNLLQDIKTFNTWGFTMVNKLTHTVNSLDDAIRLRSYYEQLKAHAPMLMDGIVIKNSTVEKKQTQHDFHERYLPGALAWKFNPAYAVAVIKDIQIQGSKQGKKTAILHVHPVKLQGIHIRKISVGSEQSLHKKQLKKGDLICLALKGHSIPVFQKLLLRF